MGPCVRLMERKMMDEELLPLSVYTGSSTQACEWWPPAAEGLEQQQQSLWTAVGLSDANLSVDCGWQHHGGGVHEETGNYAALGHSF